MHARRLQPQEQRRQAQPDEQRQQQPKEPFSEGTRGPNAFGGKARRALPTKDADEAMLDDFVA